MLNSSSLVNNSQPSSWTSACTDERYKSVYIINTYTHRDSLTTGRYQSPTSRRWHTEHRRDTPQVEEPRHCNRLMRMHCCCGVVAASDEEFAEAVGWLWLSDTAANQKRKEGCDVTCICTIRFHLYAESLNYDLWLHLLHFCSVHADSSVLPGRNVPFLVDRGVGLVSSVMWKFMICIWIELIRNSIKALYKYQLQEFFCWHITFGK